MPTFRYAVPITLASLFTSGTLSAQSSVVFGACESPSIPAYGDVERYSRYLPMSDGVRIAADVFLPKALPAGTRLPTVLISTRYWRAGEGTPPSAEEAFWVSHGYAVVYIDVRGTGASFGTWFYPWSRQEVKDIGEVVAWIVKQPWSNGALGSIGTSYTANTAQLVAASNNPAVKAVIPRSMDFDIWTENIQPGGVINDFILHDWGVMVHALDMNTADAPNGKGVRRVDEDKSGALLAAAVKEHHGNPQLQEVAKNIMFRDDTIAEWKDIADTYETFRYKSAIERSQVPIYGIGSWLDAGTGDGVIERYRSWKNSQHVLIGPWSHGAGFMASPYQPSGTPVDPSREVQNRETLCFFDHYVKGKQNATSEPKMIYYTLGEERWKSTKVWPLPGIKKERWYLSADHGLGRAVPTATTGSDDYTIDFTATTGTKNRWYTQLGGPVVYTDRSEEDKKLLTYTSAPLDSDMEITGNAIVSLTVKSTATDGNFFLYLEDVDARDKVTYVTEGELRALHRKVSGEQPPYPLLIPYHTYRRKDAAPLLPGKEATLNFGLISTSVLIKKGHRLRVALAGADKDTFRRLPSEGTPTLSVSRSKLSPSYIELPLVERR